MVAFSAESNIESTEPAEEAPGKLASQFLEPKLMHSVLSADKNTIDKGKLIEESYNQGIGAFIPEMIFANLTKNYSVAKQLYGETMLKLLTSYDPNYIQKNLGIPEFRKELQKIITEKIEQMKAEGLLDQEGGISQKGLELASIVMYVEELDRLLPQGLAGSKTAKQQSRYGEPGTTRPFKKNDRYKDIALRPSIKRAILRQHKQLHPEDLQSRERKAKGTISIIYALDASASMKGKKLETSKKAGIALAYKAITDKDKVGLVIFSTKVKEAIPPTDDFGHLLQKITAITAGRQTGFSSMMQKATELFQKDAQTKHLVILSDALPTTGEEPQKETLEAASAAKAQGITISLIGIQLDENGKKLAEQITRIGEGRLMIAQELEELDRIILQDYEALTAGQLSL